MKAWIIKDIAPMKVEAKWDCERADEVLFGMPIEILSQEMGDWYKIKTHYRYEGMMHSSQFLVEELCSEKWLQGKKKMIIKSNADIVAEPKVQGAFIAELPRGSWIVTTDELVEERWQRVVLPNGTEGFTRIENIMETPEPAEDVEDLRQALVQAAELYQGAQYRWGGKTTRGLDCSGLCSMAYMLSGILIYRDAKIVEGFPLVEIPKDEIKKGDLLFFPGHVAMYIGDDEYIHSSSGLNGVGYNSLNPQAENFNEYLFNNFTMAASIFR
ncbi:MAG: C40 family peptidase [Tissierellia bacterium]|nr:C40 family peptidase [Tissierellia bacterium]